MGLRKLNVEQLDKINYQSKISKLLFGTKTPPLITKVAFYYGIVGWAYFFLWYLAAFMSIKFINGIEHPEQIKANFNKIGLEYGIDNFQTTFGNFLMITLLCLLASLAGLFMIYRRKILGYYLYIIGWITAIVVLFIMLGFEFFWKEVTMMDKAIMFTLIVPYFLFMYMLKKSKEGE